MAQLKDIIVYVLKNYPIKDELSNARVTKIIFLSDWHQAINYNKQISPIEWFFDNYGPFVRDIYEEVKINSNIFKIKETMNIYGYKKTVFHIKNEAYEPCLSENEKQSLNHVIINTKKLGWNDFIKLVYSTYPIMSSERYSKLDLVLKAKEYNYL